MAINQNRFIDNLLYKLFFKNLKVILLAEQLYSDIKKYVSKKDIYICPNGIPQQTNMLRNEKHDGFNILFLSNMMKEKGVLDLLDACKILKEKGKTFHCKFIGKWSDISEEFFYGYINKLQIQDVVKAYGAKYGDDKKPFLETSDCFILPTHNECFPLVLLEAMEYGIACIAPDEGGIKSIIDEDKNGLIFVKKDPKSLAQKIEYLIDNPSICKKMGEAGRSKFLNNYTIDKFENNMRDILIKIINDDKH